MEFDAVIDEAIRGSKARNAKAVRALLDLGALRTSKNQKEDIAAAIEAVKKESRAAISGFACVHAALRV